VREGERRPRRTNAARLPGPEGLVVERHADGTFSWSPASPSLAEVLERASARLSECEDALELCDHWLSHGSQSPDDRDRILESRFVYAQERALLEELVAWAREEGPP